MEFGIDRPSHPIQCLSLSNFELPWNVLLQLRDVSMTQDGYEVQLNIQWSAIVREKRPNRTYRLVKSGAQ